MDLRKIKKLMEMVEASTISELEVRSGDETVRIVRPIADSAPTGGGHAAPAAPAVASRAEGHPVRAPMAGTFYVAPEPGDEPFVSPGQTVEAGDVLCIIESMKMMNEIKAERSGVCTAVCVANGQAVGAGEILFRID